QHLWTYGRRRSGHGQEILGRLVQLLGRHHGAALQRSRGHVPGRSEADRRPRGPREVQAKPLTSRGELTLALPARAKLNLDLEVIGRHSDGFHELRTTFQAIELHDLLEVRSEEHTSELQSRFDLVCRLLLE